jgi:hypothetical protein
MMSFQRRIRLVGVIPLTMIVIAVGAFLLPSAGAEQESAGGSSSEGAASPTPGIVQHNDGAGATGKTPAVAAEGAQAGADQGKDKQPQYVFRVSRDKDQLRLRGAIPSAADQKTVIGMVKASFPGLSVSERTRIDSQGPDREVWLGGVSFALRQLALLDTGTAELSNSELSLKGVAGSPEKYEAVQNALNEELPRGVKLKGAAITPPSVRPFTWFAQLHQGGLALSGHVPDKAEQEALAGLAGELFPESPLVNVMEVAAGQPAGWGSAVRQCLRVLSQLQSGSLAVSDLSVRIDGVAADEDRLKSAQELGRTLPTGFQVENGVKLGAISPKKLGDAGAAVGANQASPQGKGQRLGPLR